MYIDRRDAGRRLVPLLAHLRESKPIVLGLPRGGVPVAAEVTQALDAPLDVILVRKLGVPFQPELAMGAIGEGGVRMINTDLVRTAGVSDDELAETEARERDELERRARRYRSGRARIPLAGRDVIIVDDGIATGSTAKAACEVARAEGAARLVLAVPVAPRRWIRRLAGCADELISVATPPNFLGVGQFYLRFAQTTDEEVIACLDQAPARRGSAAGAAGVPSIDADVEIPSGRVRLAGHLTVPAGAHGIVVFAHGSGSSRHSPRNRHVATRLSDAGLATLLLDLLTTDEEPDRANVFDSELLGQRLVDATGWVRNHADLQHLSVGYFGASTGAGAALWAAADADVRDAVGAVVSRGGRPDLAGPRLADVRAPTLLIVGGRDPTVMDLNRQARGRLRCEARLEVVPGATHLFEEPGALDVVASLAADWFLTRLGSE